MSPSVDGYKPDVCGDSCKFDAAAAKPAFEAAGGYNGTMTVTYNADGPNKAPYEAVANQLKNNLGINARGGADRRLRHVQQEARRQ